VIFAFFALAAQGLLIEQVEDKPSFIKKAQKAFDKQQRDFNKAIKENSKNQKGFAEEKSPAEQFEEWRKSNDIGEQFREAREEMTKGMAPAEDLSFVKQGKQELEREQAEFKAARQFDKMKNFWEDQQDQQDKTRLDAKAGFDQGNSQATQALSKALKDAQKNMKAQNKLHKGDPTWAVSSQHGKNFVQGITSSLNAHKQAKAHSDRAENLIAQSRQDSRAAQKKLDDVNRAKNRDAKALWSDSKKNLASDAKGDRENTRSAAKDDRQSAMANQKSADAFQKDMKKQGKEFQRQVKDAGHHFLTDRLNGARQADRDKPEFVKNAELFQQDLATNFKKGQEVGLWKAREAERNLVKAEHRQPNTFDLSTRWSHLEKDLLDASKDLSDGHLPQKLAAALPARPAYMPKGLVQLEKEYQMTEHAHSHQDKAALQSALNAEKAAFNGQISADIEKDYEKKKTQ